MPELIPLFFFIKSHVMTGFGEKCSGGKPSVACSCNYDFQIESPFLLAIEALILYIKNAICQIINIKGNAIW